MDERGGHYALNSSQNKTHTVIRAKNPSHVIHFKGLVMVLLPSPVAEHIYCEGDSTNNHVAFALTVSKCCLGSFKRLLNFSVPHCHRDRKDDFTELFLKEKYLG